MVVYCLMRSSVYVSLLGIVVWEFTSHFREFPDCENRLHLIAMLTPTKFGFNV